MKSKGFTLLELLVVISIISILVAVTAVSFTTAQKQGRDSRRKQDLKTIQNAFEQYNSKNSSLYAADCATMLVGTVQGTAPTDPQTGVAYTTGATCTTSSYCVCSLLEQAGTGNSSDASCTYSTTAPDYWCISNLQ